MKVRNGFVSNSSSSSFCILGIDLPEEDFSTEEQLKPYAEKLGYVEKDWYDIHDFFYNQKDFALISCEGELVLGINIAEDSNDGSGCLDFYSIDLATVQKQAEDLMEIFGIVKPLRIYSGSKLC